jgi:hypothetical protein
MRKKSQLHASPPWILLMDGHDAGHNRQPGFPMGIRGFPPLPYNRFGFKACDYVTLL